MARIIRFPEGRHLNYDTVPPDKREQVDQLLAEYASTVERNPLVAFDPFGCKKDGRAGGQTGFLSAGRVKVKMGIAGNQSGKTTVGVADDLIQAVDRECLPEHLRKYKFWEPPFRCRVVTMDLGASLYDVMIPKFQQLVPRDQLRGGKWDKAFDKTQRMLSFANGSSIQFMSAEQDRPKHQGATLDRVHFDEEPPPPNGYGIYRESRMRVVARRGQITFTMTPSLIGAGLTWTYDEVWAKRDEPNVFVTQWSMFDNPYLPDEDIHRELQDIKSEADRRARIYGDFVAARGRVLDQFDDRVHLIERPAPRDLKGLEILVGIDPGLTRGGVVWCAFDADNHMLVFDELYPSNTPLAYFESVKGVQRARRSKGKEKPSIVEQIHDRNRYWGITPSFYVVDPASRIRDLVTASESVQSALIRAGFNTIPGQNDRKAGVFELWSRLEARPPAIRVSENCVKWRHERDRWLLADDEEALEMRAKGTAKGVEFTTIGPDHLMDPTRYVAMARLWGGGFTGDVERERELYRAGWAPAARDLVGGGVAPPLGFMS